MNLHFTISEETQVCHLTPTCHLTCCSFGLGYDFNNTHRIVAVKDVPSEVTPTQIMEVLNGFTGGIGCSGFDDVLSSKGHECTYENLTQAGYQICLSKLKEAQSQGAAGMLFVSEDLKSYLNHLVSRGYKDITPTEVKGLGFTMLATGNQC